MFGHVRVIFRIMRALIGTHFNYKAKVNDLNAAPHYKMFTIMKWFASDRSSPCFRREMPRCFNSCWQIWGCLGCLPIAACSKAVGDCPISVRRWLRWLLQ